MLIFTMHAEMTLTASTDSILSVTSVLGLKHERLCGTAEQRSFKLSETAERAG